MLSSTFIKVSMIITAVADFENNSRQKNHITIILLKLIHPNHFNEYILIYNNQMYNIKNLKYNIRLSVKKKN